MEQKLPFWKPAMTYGIFLALALILYNVILYVIGENLNKTLGIITYVIMAIGIFICQVNYRNKELNGSINYSKALGFGVAIMLCAGILNALYSVILIKIDPSIMDQIQLMQEEAMYQKGMSDEQIEMAGEVMKKFQSPIVMAISSLFVFALVGFIISLITSIFVKSKNNSDAFDEAMEEVKTEE